MTSHSAVKSSVDWANPGTVKQKDTGKNKGGHLQVASESEKKEEQAAEISCYKKAHIKQMKMH